MPDKAAALSSNPLFQLTAESKGSSIVEEESGGLKQLEGASTGREREGRQMRGGTCFVQNVIYGGFYARQKKDIIGSLWLWMQKYGFGFLGSSESAASKQLSMRQRMLWARW